MVEPVPNPEQSGVSGDQAVGADRRNMDDLLPPLPVTIVGTVQGLAASRPKSFGNDATASILSAAFAQLAHELESARAELAKRDRRIEALVDERNEAEVRIARLEVYEKSARKAARLRVFTVFVGTAMLGGSVDLYKSGITKWAILLALLGAALIIFGTEFRNDRK